uniref:Cysteine-rich protein n=1 Tax=Spironucleus salmonicida TaxID=348837 RepID=V6LBW7_9EUKA|eukprot:EST41990.1 Cysteine-rich protein [Spironucleus salmonicida]
MACKNNKVINNNLNECKPYDSALVPNINGTKCLSTECFTIEDSIEYDSELNQNCAKCKVGTILNANNDSCNMCIDEEVPNSTRTSCLSPIYKQNIKFCTRCQDQGTVLCQECLYGYMLSNDGKTCQNCLHGSFIVQKCQKYYTDHIMECERCINGFSSNS